MEARIIPEGVDGLRRKESKCVVFVRVAIVGEDVAVVTKMEREQNRCGEDDRKRQVPDRLTSSKHY